MNLLPLCTASVWPTNSGEMVQRRAHVFTTRFSFALFMVSTFFSSFASTYGPFFTERLMGVVSLPRGGYFDRRRTISLSDSLLFRVFLPFVRRPHGEHG